MRKGDETMPITHTLGEPLGPADHDDRRLMDLVADWLMEQSEEAALAILDRIANQMVAVRPVLDSLHGRARPRLTLVDAAAEHVDRMREITAQSLVGLIDRGHSSDNVARASGTFLELARPKVCDLLVDSATDVCQVEARATAVVLDDRVERGADIVRLLGPQATIAVLLGDGTTPTARAERWPQPIRLSAHVVAEECDRLGPAVVRPLVWGHRFAMEHLLIEGPRDRCRWLIKAYERGDWRRARPGTGFARDDLVAALFGNTVSGARPRASHVHQRVFDAYARGRALGEE